MVDELETRSLTLQSPPRGWRSHDTMGFLHLQLAWHLLPSRDQEH